MENRLGLRTVALTVQPCWSKSFTSHEAMYPEAPLTHTTFPCPLISLISHVHLQICVTHFYPLCFFFIYREYSARHALLLSASVIDPLSFPSFSFHRDSFDFVEQYQVFYAILLGLNFGSENNCLIILILRNKMTRRCIKPIDSKLNFSKHN